MNLFHELRAWRSYRQAVRQLDGMSDRELSDVGIKRSEIRSVVRKR